MHICYPGLLPACYPAGRNSANLSRTANDRMSYLARLSGTEGRRRPPGTYESHSGDPWLATGREEAHRAPRSRPRRRRHARMLRHRNREAERGKVVRAHKEGQGCDRFSLERKYLDGVSPPLKPAAPTAAVQSESRLPVRAGRNEAKARVQLPGRADERSNRPRAEIPLPPRRHAVDRILLEQGNEPIEIGALPRPDVALEQRTLSVVRHRGGTGRT